MNPETGAASPRRIRFPRSKAWLAVVVVLVIAAAGGAASLVDLNGPTAPIASGSDEEAVAVPSPSPSQQDIGPTVFSDPGAFVDQPLDLWAKVVEIVDPYRFRIVSENDDETSLLVAYSGDPAVSEGMELRIVGVVVPFVKSEVDEALGIAFAETIYQTSPDEYVLVAEEVTIESGRGTEIADESETTDTSVAAVSPPVLSSAAAASTESTGSAPAPPPSTNSGGGGNGGASSGNGSSGGSAATTRSGGDSNNEITYTGAATSGQYGDEAEFEATLKDRDGKAMEGAEVAFILDPGGSALTFTAMTDRRGIATTTEELTKAPGDYRLVVRYEPDNGRKTSDKLTFAVEQEDSVLDLTAESENGSEQSEGEEHGNGGNGDTLTAVLSDPDGGHAIAGRTIEFYADGELIGTDTTDEYGVATLETPSRYNKHTSFEARFQGDEYYISSADSW